jgi:hypothetical protein
MKKFKTFIEKPEFCNVPGGVKSPALAAKCAEPEKKKPAPQQADIRSKALKDKKDKWKKLGLSTQEQAELIAKYTKHSEIAG